LDAVWFGCGDTPQEILKLALFLLTGVEGFCYIVYVAMGDFATLHIRHTANKGISQQGRQVMTSFSQTA
jgi:hypothetical protein